jgi:hypothetical protein
MEKTETRTCGTKGQRSSPVDLRHESCVDPTSIGWISVKFHVADYMFTDTPLRMDDTFDWTSSWRAKMN